MSKTIPTYKSINKTCQKALNELDSGEIDNDRASSIARLTGNIISNVRNKISHKKLTNSPETLEFFEDD